MARLKLSLKFPYLKDDTRLILNENTLYKVKVRYDQKSFKGRPVIFTTTELSNEIEEVIRAVVYMFKNRVGLQPIETNYFLILPKLVEWVFPTKYPNYVFKKHNKTLETCDHLIELYVKHIDEISEQNESEEIGEAKIRQPNFENRKRPSCLTKKDNETKTTAGSRFVRDENGKLRRIMNAPKQEDAAPENKSSQTKDKSPENKRETRKRKVDKTMVSGSDQSKNKNNKRSPSPCDNKQRQHTKTKQTKALPVTTRVKQQNSEPITTPRAGDRKSPLEKNKPQTCVDCLEEHQYRRRSGRLKSKGQNTPENQMQTDKTNKQDSCLEILASPRRSTRLKSEGQTVIKYPEEVDIRDMKLQIPSIKTCKRNVNGLNSNKNAAIDTQIKRRKQIVSTHPSSPVAVYHDILNSRNRDRYVVEQLERTETNKLGELYETEGPRRSLRQAEKAGRLSGLWNRIWDTFFTPKK